MHVYVHAWVLVCVCVCVCMCLFMFLLYLTLCFTFSAGIMLTRYTIEVSLFAVTLTYGLLSGIGISLAYVTPLSCGMQVMLCLLCFVSELYIISNCCTFHCYFINSCHSSFTWTAFYVWIPAFVSCMIYLPYLHATFVSDMNCILNVQTTFVSWINFFLNFPTTFVLFELHCIYLSLLFLSWTAFFIFMPLLGKGCPSLAMVNWALAAASPCCSFHSCIDVECCLEWW